MNASFHGHDKIVEKLIAAGASLNLKNQVRLYYMQNVLCAW